MDTKQKMHMKKSLMEFLFTLDITFTAIISSFTRQRKQEFELRVPLSLPSGLYMHDSP